MKKVLIGLVIVLIMTGNIFSNPNEKKITKNYHCYEYRIGFSFTITQNKKTKKVKASRMKYVEIDDRYDFLRKGDSYVRVTSLIYSWVVNRNTFIIDRTTGHIYRNVITDNFKQTCKEYDSLDEITKILQKQLEDTLNKNLF